jgi:hypothetical protein
MSATLLLSRHMPMAVALVDRGRSWQILLDGDPAGQIAPDGTVEIPVAPGPHTLQLTSTDTRRSPERTFTADEESVTEFACHVQPVWPLLLMALVVPHRWIALRQR